MKFEPIRLDRQDEYRRYLARCPQLASDYSFVNLLGWGDEYDLQWAFSHEMVWLYQRLPRPALWAPVGDWRSADWPTLLPAMLEICPTVIRVPERLADQWQPYAANLLEFQEAREHWDYLYRVDDLANLRGNRYHKKKNLVNQFRKKYEFIYIPFGAEMIQAAQAMQEDWCQWKDCEATDTLAAENRAIERVLACWQDLGAISGGALRVDDILVGYTITERLADGTLVIHFEKGDPEYKGSYQAINQMYLQHDGQGVELVNREQDLGDEGLRKAKMSYLPVGFVKKFKVTARA